MRITDMMLTQLETEKGIPLIQSTFPEIVYGIDKANKVIWEINRSTGMNSGLWVKSGTVPELPIVWIYGGKLCEF
jgi:hypothetical protein